MNSNGSAAMDAFGIVAYCGEAVVLCAAFAACSTFILLLLKANTLHANLRFVCLNVMVCYWIYVVTRILRIYFLFVSYNGLFTILIKNTNVFVMATFYYTQLGILAERTIASFYARNYEKHKSRILPGFIILLTWSIGIPMGYLFLKNVIPLVPVLFCHLGSNVIALAGNVQLLRYNRRQITKALYFRDTALSQRYQQIENIRTVRIFSFVTLVVSFGTSGLILFAFLYVALSAKGDNDGLLAIQTAYVYLFASMLLAFPTIAILLHPELRKLFCVIILNRPPPAKFGMRNVLGHEIVVLQNQAQHFCELDKYWS